MTKDGTAKLSTTMYKNEKKSEKRVEGHSQKWVTAGGDPFCIQNTCINCCMWHFALCVMDCWHNKVIFFKRIKDFVYSLKFIINKIV